MAYFKQCCMPIRIPEFLFVDPDLQYSFLLLQSHHLIMKKINNNGLNKKQKCFPKYPWDLYIYVHTVYQLARSITNLDIWIQKYCTYIAYEMLYNDFSKIKLPVGFSFLEKLEWGKKKYVLLKYEAIQYCTLYILVH